MGTAAFDVAWLESAFTHDVILEKNSPALGGVLFIKLRKAHVAFYLFLQEGTMSTDLY